MHTTDVEKVQLNLVLMMLESFSSLHYSDVKEVFDYVLFVVI